jgi:hypothetical protein
VFRYDRIVFFLRFKQEIRQAGFIRSIPNLVILEHDAYQNYIPGGEEYCATLNRIRFFVSADVGMGEYMIKNFEAMACGCVLLAFDQGAAENQALGFKGMVNVVFYKDIPQLQ